MDFKKITAFFGFILLIMFNFSAFAKHPLSWKLLSSKTGVYQMYMPEEYKAKTDAMRISPNNEIYYENAICTVDQRPFIDVVKTHVAKMDQTWGESLTTKQMEAIIRRDLKNYAHHYEQKGAVILSEEIYNAPGYTKQGKLALVYNDEERGPQSLTVLVALNAISRLQLVLVGPDNLIDSAWSENFYKYASLNGGLGKADATSPLEWEQTKSELGYFEVYAPGVVLPYVKNAVSLEKISDRHEKATFVAHDPLRGKNIEYFVDGLKGDEVWTFEKVRDYLLSIHVVKYTQSAEGLNFKRDLDGGIARLDLKFKTSLGKSKRNDDRVHLRATFSQNYLMIQELRGDKSLAGSDFAKTLFSQTIFTPKEAFKLEAVEAMPEVEAIE